jgi:hypothetical protein
LIMMIPPPPQSCFMVDLSLWLCCDVMCMLSVEPCGCEELGQTVSPWKEKCGGCPPWLVLCR